MQQHCILILGMHRSGTSALSGMLNILDVYQGEHLMPSSSDNPKGYFENTLFFRFNEKVLYEHGSGWDDIFFSDKKINNHKYVEELKALITGEFGHARCFSIKDPRICLLFPLYEKALTEMGILICPILIYRNPLETAVSLQRRDGFSLEKGLILWMEHFLLSENYTRPYSRLLVPFNQVLKDHQALISTIQDTWQLNLEIDPDKQERLSAFLESDLKHINLSHQDLLKKIPLSFQNLVQLLAAPQKLSDDHSALDELRQAYFREKTFFFLKELRENLKEVNTYRSAQFYIDTGQGFSENQSQRILNPEDKESVELDLSPFFNVKGIRFDPLNQAVSISISSVALQLENNEWLQVEAMPLNACYISDEMDYFSHDDPQYYIPVPPTSNSRPRRVVIQANYHNMGSREVAPVVCVMLKQSLQRQRRALVNRIVSRERWWKKQSQNVLQEAALKMREIEQSLESERLAKIEIEQSLKKEQNRIHQVIAENLNIKQELQNLYDSKTWRMTKPLRNFISWWL